MESRKKNGERSLLERFAADQVAATSVEYAVIAVILGVMLLGALVPIKSELSAMFTAVAAVFESALSSA